MNYQLTNCKSFILVFTTLFGLIWAGVQFVRSEQREALKPIEKRVERVETLVEAIPALIANQKVMLQRLERIELRIEKALLPAKHSIKTALPINTNVSNPISIK